MSTPTLHEPLRGAYCDLDTLLALRVHSRWLRTPVPRSASIHVGSHRSPVRGRGLEFEEVRPYQPGDDVRTIDWRVTARSQTPYTRVFRTERERPVLLMVDQRPGMFFGSQSCFKSVLAAQLAALLAWTALAQGDRIGGLVLGSQAITLQFPRRSRRTVLTFLAAIAEHNQSLSAQAMESADANLGQALLKLQHIAPPGTSLWLLSDLADFEHPAVQSALQSLARRHSVTVVWIHDPLELALPSGGRYTVSDGRQRLSLDGRNRALQHRFAKAMLQRRLQREHRLRQLGIRWITASTQAAPLQLAGALREGLR